MSKLSFQQTIGLFKSKSEFDRHIQQSQKNYDLKVYRVSSMSRQQALTCYKQLQSKYENGVYQRLPNGWYQNQRRLFVWFVVCYSKWHPTSLTQQSVWEQLANIFFNKDPRLLKYQYMNVLKRQGRVRWTTQEDNILRTAYNNHENGQWNQIAKELFFNFPQTRNFKTPKNCRQRWNNHLNNQVKKEPFSEEQDREMLLKIKQRGKKWSLIAKQTGNKRTQHQIKNRYNSLISQYAKSVGNISTIKSQNEQKIKQDNYQIPEDHLLDNILKQLEHKMGILPTTNLLPNISENIILNTLEGSLKVESNPLKFQNTSLKFQTASTKDTLCNSVLNHSRSSLPSNQADNFNFLNTINVINESESMDQDEKQEDPALSLPIQHGKFLNPSSLSTSYPIVLKPSFQSNQQDKIQYTTSGGMTLVYCGSKKPSLMDQSLTAAIEDKLFGNGPHWLSNENRIDNFWSDKSIIHTPGGLFQDSNYSKKQMSEFKLSKKGSLEKSQVAASMEFFKLPRSDMSQQYRLLTSSTTTELRVSASMNYQFSNDIKQI